MFVCFLYEIKGTKFCQTFTFAHRSFYLPIQRWIRNPTMDLIVSLPAQNFPRKIRRFLYAYLSSSFRLVEYIVCSLKQSTQRCFAMKNTIATSIRWLNELAPNSFINFWTRIFVLIYFPRLAKYSMVTVAKVQAYTDTDRRKQTRTQTHTHKLHLFCKLKTTQVFSFYSGASLTNNTRVIGKIFSLKLCTCLEGYD